jgi:hypothetical protein
MSDSDSNTSAVLTVNLNNDGSLSLQKIMTDLRVKNKALYDAINDTPADSAPELHLVQAYQASCNAIDQLETMYHHTFYAQRAAREASLEAVDVKL